MPMNFARTGLLLAVLTGIFVALGGLIGGTTGMAIALVVAAAMNLFSLWRSDKMVLSMYGAEEVDAQSGGEYYRIVRDLAARAELPMPRVYVMNNPQPNAFATGRNPENAAVAVTTGLLNSLSRDEVAGVIAHELAHIKNRDTLIMTVTATLAGAISMIAQFGMFFGGNRNSNNGFGIIGTLAMVILAPLAAMLVQMAISRTREYSADRMGAMILGSPAPLMSGLVRIENAAHQIENPTAEANPASAHMFIINPLTGGHGWDNLFATHPSTENRIAALQQLAAEMGASGGGFTSAPRRTTVPPSAGASPWGTRRGGPWG